MYTKKLPEKEITIGNYTVSYAPRRLHLAWQPMLKGYTLEAISYRDSEAPSGTASKTRTKTLLDAVMEWDKKKDPFFDRQAYETSPLPVVLDEKRLAPAVKWLETYLSLRYVEAICEDQEFLEEAGLAAGDRVDAIGSKYFMKMKGADDKYTEFFGGCGNIISMARTLRIGTHPAPDRNDEVFRQYALWHELGISHEDCSEEDCRYCPMAASCRFQKSPVLLRKEDAGTDHKASEFRPTPAQEELIGLKEGTYLCIARAGSGKTESMASLITNLLYEGSRQDIPEEDKVDPGEILMVSFTKNSVADFKARLAKKFETLCPDIGVEELWIQTFHSLALMIVRENYDILGYTSEPKEINDVDNNRIIDELFRTKKVSGSEDLYKKSFTGILNVTNIASKVFEKLSETPGLIDDPDCAGICLSALREKESEMATIGTVQDILAAYPEYLAGLKAQNSILFSQMEPMMHEVLDRYPGYLGDYGWKYIILDEFQDSSEIQMETVKKLADCPDTKLLVAVGDDGQSIYGWRNAVVDNILSFGEKLGKDVKVINMLENWRSTPEILKLADDFLELNENRTEGRTVAGRGPNGFAPEVKTFHDEDSEYAFIVDGFKKHHDAGKAWDEMAFIARTNSELTKMVKCLSQAGIPYVLKNPMKYSENSRVKAAVKFTQNVFAGDADARTVTEGFSEYLAARYDGEMLSVRTADEVASEIESLADTFRYRSSMTEEMQKELYIKHLEALRGSDEIYDSFLDEYVLKQATLEEMVRFVNDFDIYGKKMAKRMNQDYEGVVLITAHSAKGLEWPVVALSVSCFDTPVAQRLSRHSGCETEETRRLLYVAMTRARDELVVTGQYVLSGTKNRSAKDGGPLYNRFLRELCDITGTSWDPEDHEKADRDREREIAAEERRRAGTSKFARVAERRAKRLASENSGKDDSWKAKYEEAVKNARQTTLADFA